MPYKISLSKKQASGSRYVVLRTPADKAVDVRYVIKQYVLPRGKVPVVRWVKQDALFMFNMNYLDRLMLTFPDADMSTGLRRRLSRVQRSALDAMPDDDILLPGFTSELYRFQRQGVHRAVEHLSEHGVFMLNDEMGLGKTIEAIAAMIKLKHKRVLVVTTKSGCGSWAKIINQMFPRVKYEIIDGSHAERDVKARRQVRVRLVNYEALRAKAFRADGKPWTKKDVESRHHRRVWVPDNPAIFEQRYNMLVVDEFHKVKNPAAQRTQGFLQLPRCEAELMMSGTPFLNSPLEMWPVLHRLWPSKFPSYEAFEANICIKKGSKIIAYNPDYVLQVQTWINAHSLRRRKDQVGIQMPKVIYSTVTVPMTAEQQRLYNRISDELEMELEDGTIKSITGALPHIIRLKQACFSPELYGGSKHSSKIAELHAVVDELVASGEKAIIFTQFESGCQILAREFAHHNPAYVTGKVTGYTRVNGERVSKRTVQEDKFNNDDDCKLYIGTIRANQEAISLGAGTYVIMIDEEWSPSANDQAIARSAAGGLRGINANVPVNVIRLQCENSIEQWIDSVLAAKAALFNRIVEQDGGRELLVKKVTVADLRRYLTGSRGVA